MKWVRRATVVALLLGLWALAGLDARIEERGDLWYLPVRPVTLYFGAPNAEGVAPETRWLPAGEDPLEGRLKALVEGPKDPRLWPSLPKATRIRSVERRGDLVIVDFSSDIVRDHPGGSAGELITVYSVVNTLTEVEGVRRVAWRIDGALVESLAGHVDLSRPVKRDEGLIVPLP